MYHIYSIILKHIDLCNHGTLVSFQPLVHWFHFNHNDYIQVYKSVITHNTSIPTNNNQNVLTCFFLTSLLKTVQSNIPNQNKFSSQRFFISMTLKRELFIFYFLTLNDFQHRFEKKCIHECMTIHFKKMHKCMKIILGKLCIELFVPLSLKQK